MKIGNAFSNNCIKYERDGGWNKTLSIEEYLIKIRLYLSNIDDLETQSE